MTKFIISFENTAAVESELDEVLFLKMAEDKAKTDELGDAILYAGEVSQTIQSIQEETDPEKKTEIALEYLYRSIGMQSDFSLESFNADRFNKAYRYASEGFIGKLIENHKYKKQVNNYQLTYFEKLKEKIRSGIEGNKKINDPGWQHFLSVFSSTHLTASDLISKVKTFEKTFYSSGSLYNVIKDLVSEIKTIKNFVESNVEETKETRKKLSDLEDSEKSVIEKTEKALSQFYSTYKENKNQIEFESANSQQCEELCDMMISAMTDTSKMKWYDFIVEYYTAINDLNHFINTRWSDNNNSLFRHYVQIINHLTIKGMHAIEDSFVHRSKVFYGVYRFIETSIKLK